MRIARHISELINNKGASAIRKMFEEGLQLKKQFGFDNVYDFSLGNPDLEPPDEVLQAIQKTAVLNKGDHAYMPNAGYAEARSAMADKVNTEQNLLSLPVEQRLSGSHIVMTVGAAGALNVLFKAILNPRDLVLVSVPFFPEYVHYVENHGGRLIALAAAKDFDLNLDAFESVCETSIREGTRIAAVILNSPNNPSGRIYSIGQLSALFAILETYGKKSGERPLLVCDEPYRAIAYEGKIVPPIFGLYDHALVVSSFAKSHSLAGERVGYLAVNPRCPNAETLIAACIFTNRILGFVNSPAFFQKITAQTWMAHVDYSRYEKRRGIILTIMDRLGIEYARPEGAFYLFCKVPLPQETNIDGGENIDFIFCDHLKKYRVLCAPGTGFGCAGWFRLAYCVSEKTILECEKALRQAKDDW